VGIVCAAITILIVLLFVRAVMSWFPLDPGSLPAQIYRVLISVTDWVVRPMRAIIPPAGMLDLSFLVTVLILFILRTALCG
jgi:YggT family protein